MAFRLTFFLGTAAGTAGWVAGHLRGSCSLRRSGREKEAKKTCVAAPISPDSEAAALPALWRDPAHLDRGWARGFGSRCEGDAPSWNWAVEPAMPRARSRPVEETVAPAQGLSARWGSSWRSWAPG